MCFRTAFQVLFSASFLLLSHCNSHAETAQQAPTLRDEGTRPALRFVRATRAQEVSAWEAPAIARVDGLGAAEVTATQRVRVVRVAVQPGDQVAAGAVVAEVEAPELLRALGVRSAANTRLAPLRTWRTELDAQRQAGLARIAEVREVEARLAEADAELRRAEADVRAAAVSSADLEQLLRTGHLPLRAPIAGVVRTVRAIPGRIAEPGQGPLAEIVGARPVRIEVRIHRTIPTESSLVFVPFGGEPIPLLSTPIAEAIEPETGAKMVWLRPRSETMLPAGTSGRVQVTGFTVPVVEVPLRAVTRTEGNARVFRRTANGTEAVTVHVVSLTNHTALLRGIAPDEELVADASSMNAQP